MNNFYQFIPYAEYMATEEVTDEDGVTSLVRTSPYAYTHPRARVNLEQTEVVLSCSNHTQPCTCLTKSEALAHIDTKWATNEEAGAL